MRLAPALFAFLGFACAAFAAGDAKNGAIVFGRCSQCHTITKDGGNGLGPNLFGIAGRKAGTVAGFPYSPALKNAKITWSDDALHKWISDPQKLVPGNRMAFVGIRNAQQADDLVAFLKSKK